MKKNTNHGFTLLEVMVALAICAIAGIAAMQATGNQLNHLGSLEEQTYASWVAENRMVMLRAAGDNWKGENNKRGTEELAGVTWYWQQKVTATVDPSFKKVEVHVYSDSALQNNIYGLTTYLYKAK